jgi:hypothetical protein
VDDCQRQELIEKIENVGARVCIMQALAPQAFALHDQVSSDAETRQYPPLAGAA